MSRNSQILILRVRRHSQTQQIMFPVVFATLQLPVSLEPIDKFLLVKSPNKYSGDGKLGSHPEPIHPTKQ